MATVLALKVIQPVLRVTLTRKNLALSFTVKQQLPVLDLPLTHLIFFLVAIKGEKMLPLHFFIQISLAAFGIICKYNHGLLTNNCC